MSVRDTLQWGGAARTAIELVTAQKLLANKRAFGITRMLGCSTPGQTLDTGVGLRFDFPMSDTLRVCFLAKAASLAGVIKAQVWTSNGAGGASKDFASGAYSDPATWVESGDTDGLHIAVTPSTDKIFWAQLHLTTIAPLMELGPVAPPPRQQLWLEMDGDANITYIKDVMVWEWVQHPDTPYGGRGPTSEYSEGMGSKYDIFTGL